MPQKLRYALVGLALVAAEVVMLSIPDGDLNGDVALFPDAAVWFAALFLAWVVLMFGMFSRSSTRRGLGPLVLGTVGVAVLIAANY